MNNKITIKSDESNRKISAGDIFHTRLYGMEESFILSSDSNKARLISLDTGQAWGSVVNVHNTLNISEEEWIKITDPFDSKIFKKIHGTCTITQD